MRDWQEEEVEIAASLEQVWVQSGLGHARCVEEVDQGLEQILDAECLPLTMHAEAAGEELASLLGISGEQLLQIVDVETFAPVVAGARSQLLKSGMIQCIAQAERVVRGEDATAFLQAVAVTACLQFEALGDVTASDQAFDVLNWGQVSAAEFAQVLMSTADGLPETVMVVLRNYVRSRGAVPLHLIAIDAALQSVESAQANGVACTDDEHAVLSMCEALVDAFATTNGANAIGNSEGDAFAAAESFGGQLTSALAQMSGGHVAVPASYFGYRQNLYRTVWKASPAVASHSLASAMLAPDVAQQVWRSMAVVPSLQVVAPILAAPSHAFTRIGPTAEVDAQVLPLLRRVEHVPEAGEAASVSLMAATAVVCVLAHLADTGVICGRLPDGKVSRKLAMDAGRMVDTLHHGAYVLPFDRETRVGRILAVAADLALALAYLDPVSPQAAQAAISPMGWLSLPLCDDVRFDLALSAVLAVMPLLDEGTCLALAEIVQLLRSPPTEESSEALQARLQKLDFGYAASSEWDALSNRICVQTSGLAFDLPERVNVLGQSIGAPRGGLWGVADEWASDQGHQGALARQMSALGSECRLPSRYMAGAYQSDRTYWRHAQKRGESLNRSLSDLVAGSEAMSAVFAPDGDVELRALIVKCLAMQADDQARQALVVESCVETGFLDCA